MNPILNNLMQNMNLQVYGLWLPEVQLTAMTFQLSTSLGGQLTIPGCNFLSCKMDYLS